MKQNRIMDTIIDNGLIEPGSTVIAAVSGGPDSLCLLHVLYSISDAFELDIVPVHVNHKLRPEADREADHIADICDRMDLECRVYEADCEEMAKELGIGTEEAGRNIRYQILDDVADEISQEKGSMGKIVIALAHNADDQCETVLFRLIRGTGPHGLAGIPVYRMSASGYPIVRPLLDIDREDIEEYIKENKLRPNIDRSNSENTYARNRIRNELIPYLEENYNPNIKDALRRYARLANMDDVLLRDIAFGDYSNNLEVDSERDRATLDLAVIKDNPPAVNSRIVGLVMELLDLENMVTYENIRAILDLIYSERPSAGIDLPLGIRAFREYDKLVFSAQEESINPDESIEIFPRIIMAKDFDPADDAVYAAFDFDSFDAEYPGGMGEIRLRTRQEGDYLPMKKGSKKIQDLFVDSKVKKSARDSLLLVAIGSEVLWILPSKYFGREVEKTKGRFSQKFHINETTKRVLFIELGESL